MQPQSLVGARFVCSREVPNLTCTPPLISSRRQAAAPVDHCSHTAGRNVVKFSGLGRSVDRLHRQLSGQTRRELRAEIRSMGGGSELPPSPAAANGASPVKSRLEDGDGVVIVDHGSRRAESNAMLHEFVKMYKEETGHQLVEAAHMELATPTISDAFDRCVEQGATRIIVCPYFLFPGRHWYKDIPALAAEAAKKYAQLLHLVTAPIGLHKSMVTVIQDRMEYCLSQVAEEVSECDMCKGTGLCKQLTSTAIGLPIFLVYTIFTRCRSADVLLMAEATFILPVICLSISKKKWKRRPIISFETLYRMSTTRCGYSSWHVCENTQEAVIIKNQLCQAGSF